MFQVSISFEKEVKAFRDTFSKALPPKGGPIPRPLAAIWP